MMKFLTKSACLIICLAIIVNEKPLSAQKLDKETFKIAEHNAFVIEPAKENQIEGPMPWVWYAPTFHDRLPSKDEKWMIDRLLAKGIAIAGVDVGESYGSPKGRKVFEALYDELTKNRNYSKKPALLARSRGGLMLYSWAAEHPNSVAGIAGIYPVCNIASYPGLKRAAGAYEMTAEEFETKLKEHNPIDRLAGLAKAKVPIYHIHGDSDRVVPNDKNSAILEERYKELKGPVTIEVIKGQGHNMWRGWFESENLINFMILQALGKSEPNSNK